MDQECVFFTMICDFSFLENEKWNQSTEIIFDNYIQTTGLEPTTTVFDLFITLYCTWQLNYYFVYDTDWNFIAPCVYWPPANLPNHDCNPNVFHFFTSWSVVLRALKPIGEFEDVTISYLDGGFLPEKEWNDYFYQNWGFRCWCSICLKEQKMMQ